MIRNKSEIYGVVKSAEVVVPDYKGIDTETASIDVDVKERTIKVDVNMSGILGTTLNKAYPGIAGADTRRIVEEQITKLEQVADAASKEDILLDKKIKNTESTLQHSMEQLSADLSRTSKNLSDDIRETSEYVNNIYAELQDDITKVSDELQKSYNDVRSEISTSSDNLNNDLNTAKKDLTSQINTLSESLTTRIETLENDTSTTDYVNRVFETKQDAASNYNTLQQGISDVEVSLKDISDNLKTRIETLENDPTTKDYVDSQIQSLSNSLDSTYATDKALSDLAVVANTAYSSLNNDINELEKYIDTLVPLQFTTAPHIVGTALFAIDATPELTIEWAVNKPSAQVSIDEEVKESTTATVYGSKDKNSFEIVASRGTERISKTVSATFTYRVYYGSASEITTYEDISKLSSKLSTTSKIGNVTVNIKTNEYFFFLCPAEYSIPSFSVSGFTGGVEKLVDTISVPYGDSLNVEYSIYKSNNHSLGKTIFNIGG